MDKLSSQNVCQGRSVRGRAGRPAAPARRSSVTSISGSDSPTSPQSRRKSSSAGPSHAPRRRSSLKELQEAHRKLSGVGVDPRRRSSAGSVPAGLDDLRDSHRRNSKPKKSSESTMYVRRAEPSRRAKPRRVSLQALHTGNARSWLRLEYPEQAQKIHEKFENSQEHSQNTLENVLSQGSN